MTSIQTCFSFSAPTPDALNIYALFVHNRGVFLDHPLLLCGHDIWKPLLLSARWIEHSNLRQGRETGPLLAKGEQRKKGAVENR